MNFWGTYILKMLTPIFLCFSVLAAFGVRILVHQRFPRFRLISRKPVQNQLYAMLSFLIVGLYTFCVSSVFHPLNCVKQVDGTFTLSKYPSVTCFDRAWMEHLPVTVFFLVLYCVFIPMFFIGKFYLNRNNVDSPKFANQFPNLLSPYKRGFYYFELIFMLRKALIVVANDFLPSTGSYTVRFSVIIMLLWLFTLVDCSALPYKNEQMNLLQSR
jgi:hypothetical protein